MSEGLPLSWVISTIGSISEIVGGGTPNSSDKTNFCSPPKGIPWLSPVDLSGYKSKYVSHGRRNLSEKGYKNCSAKLIPKGTVVFSSRAPIGYVAIANNPLSTNQGFRSIVPHKYIFNEYIYYYLYASKAEAEKLASGSTFKEISGSKLKQLPIPLPPLNEQKRIVAKLDAVMPRIEAVKERLEKIPAILKRFRQSVLGSAIRGKLTEKWRELNPEVKIAEEVVKKLFEKRVYGSKTIIQKKKIENLYSEVESGDNEILPESWRYVFLNKLCDSFQYGTSKKSDKEGKIPVLRMGNLQNGKIDWKDLVYTSDDEEIRKYCLEDKTVLFNRTNSPELVGKTSIYEAEKKAIFAGYLIRINNYNVLDSYYLNYCLNTSYAKEFCYRQKTDGVSQSNINAQKLAHFEIPFPPIEEQKEIVRQVDKLFALADKVEAHYQKARGRVDKLSQSILAKAFRGELVGQDPNDESAEKLLERIRQEKVLMERELKESRTRRIRKKAAKKTSRSIK